MDKSLLFATMTGMYLLGKFAAYTKRHKNDSPKQKLLYAYVNLAFGVVSACCILESFLEGLMYAFVIAIISASGPIVLNDIAQRFGKITSESSQ